MELWIRTQNEGLHKIIGISEPIRVSDMFVLNGDNSCGKKRLGTYKTKERTLEVLDEIQRIFYSNQKYINNVVVYEMPEK